MEIIAIGSAIVGPILGALFAWIFARQERKENNTHHLIIQTMQDLQTLVIRSFEVRQFAIASARAALAPDAVAHQRAATIDKMMLMGKITAEVMAFRMLYSDKANGVRDLLFEFTATTRSLPADAALSPADHILQTERISEDFANRVVIIFNEMMKMKMSANIEEI